MAISELPGELIGIHQSDLIIRSAIIAGIERLRASPWLLDYAFASLSRDDLTKDFYGEKDIEAAKRWFQRTNINVFMATDITEPKFPAVTITLLESNEDASTLGDVHYEPRAVKDDVWPALAGPFSAAAYNQVTGALKVPKSVTSELVLAPGMFVIDSTGKAHESVDLQGLDTLMLKPGTVANFSDATIKGTKPALITHFESIVAKETYLIGCHVAQDRVTLTWLHSLIWFVLLRYRQALLEARGFERVTVSNSDFRRNPEFEAEVVYSRHMQVGGYARQVWPKEISQTIQSANTLSTPNEDDNSLDSDALDWLDQDMLGGKA